MEEKKPLLNWVKEHKTELIKFGMIVVGTVLVFKNGDSIKGVLKSSNSVSAPVANISSDVLGNLTGNKLTATGLGNKVMRSAQEINTKIVAAKLATKLPNGGYSLTEAGRIFGENTSKSTRYGHSFSNIEWDEKILEYIFNPKELLEIANKQKIVHKILSKFT